MSLLAGCKPLAVTIVKNTEIFNLSESDREWISIFEQIFEATGEHELAELAGEAGFTAEQIACLIDLLSQKRLYNLSK